jgi:hypothetical protein
VATSSTLGKIRWFNRRFAPSPPRPTCCHLRYTRENISADAQNGPVPEYDTLRQELLEAKR